MMSADTLLANLNQSQYAAVSSFADQLAILAGPGSGKTHTLTSRTAWLLAQGLQPWNIIVATFTVKAAREMKERIGKLLGNGLESKLILGTFHSIARRYLSRYGHLIGIRKDFGIADIADSLAVIKRIVKRNNFTIDPKVARSRISGKKARGTKLEENLNNSRPNSIELQEFESCYNEYEEALRRSNLLDYDDLLLRCVDLLREHPSCVSNIEAVLIDEFQDTNVVQFDLMRLFAAQRKRITIVGDPDQSIYGFRAAEIKNYKRMLRQYPDTVTIALEENYRSSGAILLTALGVIEQDTSRVAKTLQPTHTVGTQPVLRQLTNAQQEAEWIVNEVKRVLALTGELMELSDFAILLRSASLSRLIESALGKAGIAYRMVGGLRFYDRVEVKTILDYLRVVDQPENNDALSRILNTPSRRIGEATIRSLLEEADQSKITLWCLILGVAQGKKTAKTKLSKQTDQALSRFVNLILTAQNKTATEEQPSISDLMKFLVQRIDFETWLEDHHADVHKARWANVEELMNQARDFQEQMDHGYEDDTLPVIEGLEQTENSSPLSKFLANVALASEVKKDADENTTLHQVTISTIHAAKGLEWPVVFVPATYQGSIPHSRADDEDEERRLLYVAMTRAKALLYMSYPDKSSQGEKTNLSPFLSHTSLRRLLRFKGPDLGSASVQTISLILGRAMPSLASVAKSAALLTSPEDDLFATILCDQDQRQGSATDGASIHRNFTIGPNQPKRRRVDIGESVSGCTTISSHIWRPAYMTTMERASLSSAGLLDTRSEFVSAGSHLAALDEQSTDHHDSKIASDHKHSVNQVLKDRKSNVKSRNRVEGQSTLHGFLGKPKPSMDTLPREISFAAGATRSQSSLPNLNLKWPKVSQPNAPPTIEPVLATHAIYASGVVARKKHRKTEDHNRNDYVFLSSSPPRPNLSVMPESKPDDFSEHVSKLDCRPSKRFAISKHATTLENLQEVGAGPRKTLGVKRSMNGWHSRQNFVPLTIKRFS